MNHLSFYRYRIALYATVAVSFLVFASCLPAQNLGVQVHQTTPDQVQVQMLVQRVSQLEKKLAKLEAQVLHDEQTPQSVDDKDDTPVGLSKADRARLDGMEKQIAQLEAAQKKAKTADTPNRVTAPFQVVDDRGTVIMEVAGGPGAAYTGLQVWVANRSFVRLGTEVDGGFANVAIHKPGKDVPRLVMGMRPNGTPSIAILGDGTGNFSSELTETSGGGGESHYWNPGGKLVARIGSGESTNGHMLLTDSAGNENVKIGTLNGHGETVLVGHGKVIPVYDFAILGIH